MPNVNEELLETYASCVHVKNAQMDFDGTFSCFRISLIFVIFDRVTSDHFASSWCHCVSFRTFRCCLVIFSVYRGILCKN